MPEEIINFLNRHSTFIITTHEKVDADGLGAEIAFAQICRDMGKNYRIINSGPIPELFVFLDKNKEIEIWEKAQEQYNFSHEEFALAMLDSSDEYNIGGLKNLIPLAREVFFIDHHDDDHLELNGYRDSSASSTSELIAEIAIAAGISLNSVSKDALYAGIVYDSGSFSYSKTTTRTFRIALKLVEGGVIPNKIFHELNECHSTGALLLHKQVFSTLEILNQGRVAVQILRKEALESSKAQIDDAESFINDPLKARDVEVSVLVKENAEGQVRCSLRSKGAVNVSKIAQAFGGGGHVAASGFKSGQSIEETLSNVLEKITAALDKTS